MNFLNLTLPQYHRRGGIGVNRDKLNDPDSWAEARSNPTSPLYFPDDINQYDALVRAAEVAGDDLSGEAWDITKFIAGRFTHIFSAGSGAAKLEYCIHQVDPNIRITLSEHSEDTVSRLRRVFHGIVQIKVEFLDLFEPDALQLSDSSVLLLYRLGAEFSNKQWKKVLSELHGKGVRHILFIPSAPLKARRVFQLLLRIYPYVLINRGNWTFTGYLRTRSAFDRLLRRPYKIKDVVSIGRNRLGWHLVSQ